MTIFIQIDTNKDGLSIIYSKGSLEWYYDVFVSLMFVCTVTNGIDPDLQSTKGSLKSHFEFTCLPYNKSFLFMNISEKIPFDSD